MSDRFLTFVRHGEVAGGPRFGRSTDLTLTARGHAQLALVLEPPARWDAVASSPALRCRSPAEDLAQRLRLPLVIDPELAERDFGAWDGLPAEALDPADLARFYADPVGFTPPGAEPLGDFVARVGRAFRRRIDAGAGHGLVLTHGGVIRAVLAEVLSLPLAALLLIEVPHACVTRIRVPVAPWRPSLIAHGGPWCHL